MNTIYRYCHYYSPLPTEPCHTSSLRYWCITIARLISPILPIRLLWIPIVKRTLSPWGLLVALAGYITIQRRKLKKVSPSGSMLVSIPTLPTSQHVASYRITRYHINPYQSYFPLLALSSPPPIVVYHKIHYYLLHLTDCIADIAVMMLR